MYAYSQKNESHTELKSTWAYINDGRIFILVLAVPLRAHSRPFPWSESGTNSPSEGPLPGHLLQAQSVFVYPQNHSKSKSMFGTALGGKLQTIRRSDMGFLLAPSFFFLFSFPLSLSSHTSQQNVTEECFPLAAHRHVWRRAWPPLSAERVKMLMRILQSSEGLNKVFISCRLTFIYLFYVQCFATFLNYIPGQSLSCFFGSCAGGHCLGSDCCFSSPATLINHPFRLFIKREPPRHWLLSSWHPVWCREEA